MVREGRLYDSRSADELQRLAERRINYPPMRGHTPARADGWHVDSLFHTLAQEQPGDPKWDGAWELACRLVRDYQFAEPGIIRALYRDDVELLGRDMLLEGHFYGLRFDMGVRVTSVIDETRGTGEAAQRVWGWGYQTLDGHLEEGELVYEVIKHLHTGEVDFHITGYSRRAPIANPVVRLGFTLFGRIMQQRFYRACGRRLQRLVQAQLAGDPPIQRETAPRDASLTIAPTVD